MKDLFNSQQRWLLPLLAVMMAFSLSACGDDDKDSPKANSEIVGAWTRGTPYWTETYYFNNDGSYTYVYEMTFDDFYDVSNEDGSYFYNGSTLSLTGSGGYGRVYIVMGIDANNLVLMNEEGETYSYRRIR